MVKVCARWRLDAAGDPAARGCAARVHQPTQLRSPRHPRDIMTPTGASNPQSHKYAKGREVRGALHVTEQSRQRCPRPKRAGCVARLSATPRAEAHPHHVPPISHANDLPLTDMRTSIEEREPPLRERAAPEHAPEHPPDPRNRRHPHEGRQRCSGAGRPPGAPGAWPRWGMIPYAPAVTPHSMTPPASGSTASP